MGLNACLLFFLQDEPPSFLHMTFWCQHFHKQFSLPGLTQERKVVVDINSRHLIKSWTVLHFTDLCSNYSLSAARSNQLTSFRQKLCQKASKKLTHIFWPFVGNHATVGCTLKRAGIGMKRAGRICRAHPLPAPLSDPTHHPLLLTPLPSSHLLPPTQAMVPT